MKQFKTITLTLIFLFTASAVSCYAESSELRKLINKVNKCEQENATQKDMASAVELANKVIEKIPKRLVPPTIISVRYMLAQIVKKSETMKKPWIVCRSLFMHLDPKTN